MNFNDIDMENFNIKGSTFNFSAVRVENLNETEYTIVNLIIDVSGSVSPFSSDLDAMLKEVVRACKKSPRMDNILFRVSVFNSSYREVHGYMDLSLVDENSYDQLVCGGGTALFDAVYVAIGSSRDYADTLDKQDIITNGIVFIITDGDDNSSMYPPSKIQEAIRDIKHDEVMDSFLSILIGVNVDPSSGLSGYLDDFKNEANIDQYISMGEVTPSKLAKLGGFISKSISSQSQSLGTGTSASVSLSF